MRKPDDWHVHLREGAMLQAVLPYTAHRFKRALVMPNLKEPITHGRAAAEYRDTIKKLAENDSFEPVMTLKLLKGTVRDDVSFASGIVKAVKLYPDGVTTNSSTGIAYPLDVTDHGVYDMMVEKKMVLCIHGEMPGSFCMDKEEDYLDAVDELVTRFPDLRVVLEHVTTEEAVEFVKHRPNMAATITAHHLAITLDDVVGTKLRPHNFCMPIAKTPHDREALQDVAFSGHRQFFLGTDSAPHDQDTKECAEGCAGCFTAPLAIQLLAQLFDKAGHLENLEQFMSMHGAMFYDMPLNKETITLTRAPWKVPEFYRTSEGVRIIPFMAGKTLDWTLEDS